LRELELAICRLTHLRQRSQFDIEFLANEELWVFVSKDHALAARAAVSLDEVSRFPWVLQPWASPARQAIESAFAAERVSSPEARVETTSIFAALHLVREAGMVGVLPSTILSESVARADLVRLPISHHQVVTVRNQMSLAIDHEGLCARAPSCTQEIFIRPLAPQGATGRGSPARLYVSGP
jgi:DNA-binding transcriptional LysR family regulator